MQVIMKLRLDGFPSPMSFLASPFYSIGKQGTSVGGSNDLNHLFNIHFTDCCASDI